MIRHKFLIGDVLKKVTTKKLPVKAKTLPKATNGDKSLVPLMAAGVENQGCVGFVKPNEPTVLHNLITVSANGANSGATFYQQRKFSILQDAYALELVDKYADYASDDVYLYLTAVVDHRLKDNGYNNKATWNRIKNYYIELPVTPAGDPDFEYMTMRIRELEAKRIRELEAKRIRELEAYLNVTGLDDATLSVSEAQALTQKVQWKKFKIGELFTVTSGKWLSKVDQKPGKTPFISSSAKNNGIMTYIDKNPLFPANTITVASHGSVGVTFFQTVPYYASSNVNSLSYKNGNLSEKVGLYFVAAIQHVSKNYGFSHILSVTRTKRMEVMLPVTPAGEIDFDYMQNYIRATEKQTIKGVVEYKDRVVEGTKKIMNG